jgi:hypothetical protein
VTLSRDEIANLAVRSVRLEAVSGLRRRVATNPAAARLAALPIRLRSAAARDIQVARSSGRWLLRSREHTNLTYELEPESEEHLAWFVSCVTGAPVSDVRRYMGELDDPAIERHVREATLASTRRGIADLEPRFGRRKGWYAFTRVTKPRLVVECGIDKGLGSLAFAAALLRNRDEGQDGRLIAIDISPDAGYLVRSGPYTEVTDFRVSDSLSVLRGLDEPVDAFIHDSDHDPAYERQELLAAVRLASDQALLMSDNPSLALPELAEEHGMRYLAFQERTPEYWLAGSCFGVAWRPR